MATIEQIVKVKREIAQRIIGGQKPSAADLALNDACNTLIDRAFSPVDTEREDKMVDAYLARRTIDTAAAESLRAFALEHNEIAFAHLVTAALCPEPEEWAIERVAAVLANTIIDPTSAINTVHALNLIKFTDTTRPDGAIARSTVAP